MGIEQVLAGTENWTIVQGHVLTLLRAMPDECVQVVITSPPYWGLRVYETEPQVWGGRPDCDHQWEDAAYVRRSNDDKAGGKQETNRGSMGRDQPVRNWFCSRCGAWKGDLGLEPNPQMYVEHLVEVFREVRRVLRRDGSLWLNLGDCYASAQQRGQAWGDHSKRSLQKLGAHGELAPRKDWSCWNLRPKQLVGMPWRVAFALQADGWILRSAVIWEKPNAMTESVDDRPSVSHEYVFLLAKSGEKTFWTHRDLPGTRVRPAPDYRWIDRLTGEETATEPEGWRIKTMPGNPKEKRWRRINLWSGHDYYYDQDAISEPAVTTRPELLQFGPRPDRGYPGHINDRRRAKTNKQDALGKQTYTGFNARYVPLRTRNKRTVWRIPPEPFEGAHFAVYPTALVEPCVLAGSAPQACPVCGAPWSRVVQKQKVGPEYNQRGPRTGQHPQADLVQGRGKFDVRYELETVTIGWRPTCSCPGNDGRGRCVVLDPFSGSGTTGVVALRLGRRYIGLELNPEYVEMSRERIQNDMPLVNGAANGGAGS